MKDNVAVLLDKAYYVRSKIGNYPLSHSILPIPNGMSAVIFKNDEDINQYYKVRGIDDFENFEKVPVPYDKKCLQEGTSVFEWNIGDRELILTNGNHICPKCGDYTLTFEDAGRWD